MTARITKDTKDVFIEELAACGVIKLAAQKAEISVPTIYNEMKRSDIFKRRVERAISEGRTKVGDSALENIIEIAHNLDPKAMKHRLTANIALANAFVDNFKGSTKVSGRVEHDVIVRTGIPRPNYAELTQGKESAKVIEGEVVDPHKTSHGEGVSKEDKDKLKALNSGAPINSIDKAVNKVIENEVDNDN